MKTTNIYPIRLPTGLRESLEKEAARQGVTLGAYIKSILIQRKSKTN